MTQGLIGQGLLLAYLRSLTPSPFCLISLSQSYTQILCRQFLYTPGLDLWG